MKTYGIEERVGRKYFSTYFYSEWENREAFIKGCELAKAKGFEVQISEHPGIKSIGATVEFLKSTKAMQYAQDLLERGMKEQGLIRPFSISRK